MRKTIRLLLCGAFLSQGLIAQVDTLIADSLRTVVIQEEREKPLAVFNVVVQDLKSQGISSLTEGLGSTSLHLRNYGPGQLASLSIRGSNANQTTVLWNGINVNSPMLGQADLAIIPLAGIDELEIRYGYANKRDGFGGIGGSVNLNSKIDSISRIKLQTSIGSFGDYRASADATYKASAKTSMRTLISGIIQENDFEYTDYTEPTFPTAKRIQNAFNQYSIQQHVLHEIKQGQSIKLHSLWTSSFREIPPVIGASSVGLETQSDELGILSLAYLKNLGYWHVEADLGYRYMFMNYFNERLNLEEEYTMHGLQSRFLLRRRIGEKSIIRLNGLTSFDDVNSAVYSENRSQIKVGVQFEQVVLKNTILHISLQPEWFDGSFNALLPTLGLTSQLIQNKLNARVSYSQNVRVPTLNDLYWPSGGNPNLNMEEGYTYEVGLDYVVESSKLRIEPHINGFYSETNSLIQWSPGDFGNPEVRNVDKTNNYGVEARLSSSYELSSKWKLQIPAELTFVKAIDQEKNSLIYVPPLEFVVNPSVHFLKQSVQLRYTYVDERFINGDNTQFLPAFDLLDLQYHFTDFQFNANIEGALAVGIQNALDKKYMVLAGRPMPGRNFRITVNFNIL